MLFLDQAPILFADKMPWQVPVQGEVVEAFAQGGDTCFNHVCIYNIFMRTYIYIYIHISHIYIYADIIICFFVFSGDTSPSLIPAELFFKSKLWNRALNLWCQAWCCQFLATATADFMVVKKPVGRDTGDFFIDLWNVVNLHKVKMSTIKAL